MEHTWEVENIDGGPVGDADFWICRRCGASGGPVDKWTFNKSTDTSIGMSWVCVTSKRAPTPFLAGEFLLLSDDCDAAKLAIANYKVQNGL